MRVGESEGNKKPNTPPTCSVKELSELSRARKQHNTGPRAAISISHSLFFFPLTLCISLMDLLPSFSLFHASLIVLFLNDVLQLFIYHNKWTQVNMFAQTPSIIYWIFFSAIWSETLCNLFFLLLSSITFKVFIFIFFVVVDRHCDFPPRMRLSKALVSTQEAIKEGTPPTSTTRLYTSLLWESDCLVFHQAQGQI